MVTWTPTAENINALPEGVRDYIHRLEANTDPQGEVKRAEIIASRIEANQSLGAWAAAPVQDGFALGAVA